MRGSRPEVGSVDKSLPKVAALAVNWSPVNCMPSPESPANLMMTWSILRTIFFDNATSTVIGRAASVRTARGFRRNDA